MGTALAFIGRKVAVNTTIVLTVGTAAFAVHVTHPPHTAPHKGDNYVSQTWGTVR